MANTSTTKSKHRIIPVSAQDGNLYADDDKPKYIEEVYNYENEKVLSGSQGPCRILVQ